MSAVPSTNELTTVLSPIQYALVLLSFLIGQSLFIILGNTGSGKSTLANAVANRRLKFSNNLHSGPQLQLAPGENGSAISGGANSETDRPVLVGFHALLGQLIDCPGFRDSRGTTNDVVHTCLIHYALTKATSVRVILVVSQSEIEGLRAEGLKSVLKNLKMFPEDFIRTSVMLVVNKCFNATLDKTQLVEYLKQRANSDQELVSILSLIGDKVIQLPLVMNEDAVNNFQQQVQRMIEMAAAMEARKPHPLNMEMALSALARMELISHIKSLLSIALEEHAQSEWPRIAEERKYSSTDLAGPNAVDEMEQVFRNAFNEREEVKLFESVLDHPIQVELAMFLQDGGTFMQRYERFVQDFRLNEANARESTRRLMTEIVQDVSTRVWPGEAKTRGEKPSDVEAARESFYATTKRAFDENKELAELQRKHRVQYEEALKCVKDEVFQQEFALFVQKLRTKEAENKPPQVIVREVPRKRRGFFPNLWAYESTFWDPWVGGAH